MPSLRTTPPGQSRPGCITILALLLFLISGLLIHFHFFHEPLIKTIRSTDWDPVQCEIVSSRMDSAPRAEITYRFKHNGKSFKKTRISFFEPASTREEIQRILDKYPPGSQAVCYVDPKSNPDDPYVVLERGFKPSLLIDLIPVSMVIGSIAGLAAIYVLSRAKNPDPDRVDTRYCPTLRPFSNRRPIRLHATRNIAGIPTAFLLAVGWNLCAFFLIKLVIRIWLAGAPGCHELNLTFFALLISIIGVLLVVLLAGMLIRVYNPHPRVKIESLKILPGQEVLIDWKIRGLRWFLKSMTIVLEGREEVTYMGHNGEFETAREVFLSTVLHQQDNPPRTGVTPLKAPAGPPSFTGKRNAIIWVVKFSFSMTLFPHVEDEMELTLLPERPAC